MQDNEQCLHHGHRVSPKTKCLCLHLLFCLSPFSVSAQEKVQRFLFAKQLFQDGSSICTLLVNRDREDRETASTSVAEWSPPFPTYRKKEREEDEQKKKGVGEVANLQPHEALQPWRITLFSVVSDLFFRCIFRESIGKNYISVAISSFKTEKLGWTGLSPVTSHLMSIYRLDRCRCVHKCNIFWFLNNSIVFHTSSYLPPTSFYCSNIACRVLWKRTRTSPI